MYLIGVYEGMNIQPNGLDRSRIPTNGMAICSLVMGLITVLTSIFPGINFIALLTGLVGVVMALIGIRQIKREPDRMKGSGRALTGLLLNVAGLAITIFWLVLLVAVVKK